MSDTSSTAGQTVPPVDVDVQKEDADDLEMVNPISISLSYMADGQSFTFSALLEDPDELAVAAHTRLLSTALVRHNEGRRFHEREGSPVVVSRRHK